TTISKRSSRRPLTKQKSDSGTSGAAPPSHAKSAGYPAPYSICQEYAAADESNENGIGREVAARAGTRLQRASLRRTVEESPRQSHSPPRKRIASVAGNPAGRPNSLC